MNPKSKHTIHCLYIRKYIFYSCNNQERSNQPKLFQILKIGFLMSLTTRVNPTAPGGSRAEGCAPPEAPATGGLAMAAAARFFLPGGFLCAPSSRGMSRGPYSEWLGQQSSRGGSIITSSPSRTYVLNEALRLALYPAHRDSPRRPGFDRNTRVHETRVC